MRPSPKLLLHLKRISIYTDGNDYDYAVEFYAGHTLIFRIQGGQDEDTELFINGFREACKILHQPTTYVEQSVVDKERYDV